MSHAQMLQIAADALYMTLRSMGGSFPRVFALAKTWAEQESGLKGGSEGDGKTTKLEVGLLRISSGDLQRICQDETNDALVSAAFAAASLALGIVRANGDLLAGALWARTAHAMGHTDADSILTHDTFRFKNTGGLDPSTWERRCQSCINAANAFSEENKLGQVYMKTGPGTYTRVQSRFGFKESPHG